MSGCVGSCPSALLCPGVYNAVKTALIGRCIYFNSELLWTIFRKVNQTYWTVALLSFRTIGPSDYWTFGLSDYWVLELSEPRTIGLSDYWTFGLLGLRTIGPTPVDLGFEPRSGQTKDYEISICCFSAKHAALRRKSKDWLARNQAYVSL